MKVAGIITIGNEILQGYTLDSNANTISKELTKRNIKVNKTGLIVLIIECILE